MPFVAGRLPDEIMKIAEHDTMNMIPVNSATHSVASNYQPPAHRAVITTIDKHIRNLPHILELINPYLTGKEVARFKATCSPLSHLSLPLLGKFRGFLERRLAEFEKKFEFSQDRDFFDLILLKAMIGDFESVSKLTEKLPLEKKLKAFDSIAHILTAHPYLRSVVETFDRSTLESCPDICFFSLLEYKINPTHEKLENVKQLIKPVFPIDNNRAAFDLSIIRLLHNADPAYQQIGRYIKSEEFRKMPEAELQSAFGQRNLILPTELIKNPDEFTFLEAEALAERGEKELALLFVTFCEAIGQSLPPNFLLKAIVAKAIIDFEKALEDINLFCRNNGSFIQDVFCNFDFFSKTKLTSKELLQKLPPSFFDSDERPYFFYVLQQVAEGNPIKETREISNRLSNLTFRVCTLCWCAREITNNNRHLAVKYLEEAIEQASKTEDVRAFLMNFKVILSVSTKIA